MKIKDYENEVLEYFQKLSFSIEKIPESNEKTPDFLISGSEKILIELKAKFDAKELRDEQENVLTSGEVFQHGELTGYTNKVAKVISDGKSQLKKQKRATESDFCFLFIVASGVNASTQVKQFHSTFYGIMPIVDFADNSNIAKNCYYFTESQFFRCRDTLDGAFLVNSYSGQLKILINDKSLNYEKLKKSKFWRQFAANVPYIDPVELESKGSAYIADCLIERKEADKVQQYVFDKYGIQRGMCHNFENIVFQAR
ncbi:hypothetical protein ACWOKN_004326 [Vibrio vulnificus]|nr:hypothetical protein [Vibrio vulnificus]EHH0850049.1 hypothetical protein [Vibrio vulnificus]EHU5129688.1 hypothetical protein [Vibrio vulnificus]EHW0628643.1 hypothetical protein [Vibrio vulnificus]ELX4200219.1 hypothetical protein [Vibrio vulnificus]